jgi:hypothetical protein
MGEKLLSHLQLWLCPPPLHLNSTSPPCTHSLLPPAVRALRERPVLFKYCAEEVATARHNALFQRFITALTQGGPNGVPRPIEIHAHDPQRYINDMLAWVHQVRFRNIVSFGGEMHHTHLGQKQFYGIPLG